MSQYFPKPFGGDISIKVDLFNYAKKTDLKCSKNDVVKKTVYDILIAK